MVYVGLRFDQIYRAVHVCKSASMNFEVDTLFSSSITFNIFNIKQYRELDCRFYALLSSLFLGEVSTFVEFPFSKTQ